MRYKPRKKRSTSIYRAPDPLCPPDIKQRKCLSCSDMFESQGAGNRICEKCGDRQNRFDRVYKITGGPSSWDQ